MALVDRNKHRHAVFLYLANPDQKVFSPVKLAYRHHLVRDQQDRVIGSNPIVNVMDRFTSYSSFVTLVGPAWHDPYGFTYSCTEGFITYTTFGFQFNKDILDVRIRYNWKHGNPSGTVAGNVKDKIREVLESIGKGDVNITMAFAEALTDVAKFYAGVFGLPTTDSILNHIKHIMFFLVQGKIVLPEKEMVLFDGFEFDIPNLSVEKTYITITDEPNQASINLAVRDLETLKLLPRLLHKYTQVKDPEILKKLDEKSEPYEPLLDNIDLSQQFQRSCSGLGLRYLPLVRTTINKVIKHGDEKIRRKLNGEDIETPYTLKEAFVFTLGTYIYTSSDEAREPTTSLLIQLARKRFPNISDSEIARIVQDMSFFGEGDLFDRMAKFVRQQCPNVDWNQIQSGIVSNWSHIALTGWKSDEFFGNVCAFILFEFFDLSEYKTEITEMFKAAAEFSSHKDKVVYNQATKSDATGASKVDEKALSNDEFATELANLVLTYTLSGLYKNGLPKFSEGQNKTLFCDIMKILGDTKNYNSPFSWYASANFRAAVFSSYFSPPQTLMTASWLMNGFNTEQGKFSIFYMYKYQNGIEKVRLAGEGESFIDGYIERAKAMFDTLSVAPLAVKYNKGGKSSTAICSPPTLSFSMITPAMNGASSVFKTTDRIINLYSSYDAAAAAAEELTSILSKMGFIMFLPPGGYNFVPDLPAIVSAIVNNTPCINLTSSSENDPLNDVIYIVSYYSIIMRNIKRIKINNDNALTQTSLMYLLPENVQISSSEHYTYPSSPYDYSNLGYPTWVKLNISFKPMHKWIFFFGNYFNINVLYDILQTGKVVVSNSPITQSSGAPSIYGSGEKPRRLSSEEVSKANKCLNSFYS